MAINNKDRTFDLVSGTDSVFVWNPLLKLVRGSISGTRMHVTRWVHLRRCGKFDPLASCVAAVQHKCTSILPPITPNIEYHARSCLYNQPSFTVFPSSYGIRTVSVRPIPTPAQCFKAMEPPVGELYRWPSTTKTALLTSSQVRTWFLSGTRC